MLTLTKRLSRPSSTHHSSLSGNAAAPAVIRSSATSATTRNDQLALTEGSQARNPFEGVAPGFDKVKVDAWGQGDNSSVMQILINQGYTSKEIYSKGDSGRTLLDEVSRVNNLRNPNLIRAGQDLTVPSKQARERTHTPGQVETQTQTETDAPTQRPVEQTAAQPQAGNAAEAPEPAVNSVRVDKWGDGPNSSLGAILKAQGFEHNAIFSEDADGDSLLKKVARANGLSDPNLIRAGSSLQVPNSLEALNQMNIPERPEATNQTAQTPQPQVSQPTNTNPQPEVTKPPATVEATQPVVTQPAVEATQPDDGQESEVTANMGMLLNGVKEGKFTRPEFQYLNARSSRYTQMRARFSKDGYNNEELSQLGQMERRYGVEFARLAESDTIALPNYPATSNDPDLSLQVRHYHESGPLYDSYKGGQTDTEEVLGVMTRQRAEARQQEVQ